MGKSKKRSLHLGRNDRFANLSRSEAVSEVVQMLKDGDKEAYGLITLFGFTAEEVLEAGAGYEEVKGLENFLK